MGMGLGLGPDMEEDPVGTMEVAVELRTDPLVPARNRTTKVDLTGDTETAMTIYDYLLPSCFDFINLTNIVSREYNLRYP